MRSRSVSTNRRSMILQGQVALLAFVFVASQLGSHWHAVSERHVRCPEHGELIHVDALPVAAAHLHAPMAGTAATGRDTASDTASGTHSGDVAALRSAGSAADGHEHEHCYLCPVSRERLGTVPKADAIAATMPAVVVHSLPAVVAHSGPARYVIAPKTSPPR